MSPRGVKTILSGIFIQANEATFFNEQEARDRGSIWSSDNGVGGCCLGDKTLSHSCLIITTEFERATWYYSNRKVSNDALCYDSDALSLFSTCS